MVLIFLLKTFYFRIIMFFRHWYVDSFYVIWGWLQGRVRGLEKNLALRLNLRFIFVPLYQEYNVYGYVLGFIFRTLRIFFGGILYLFVFLVALAAYLVWAAVPIFFVYKALVPGSESGSWLKDLIEIKLP
ncbi:MAG: hypothetical protein UV58_C0012G0017 [Candidatus Wolfebacteria bacterium GW2011_GWC1_43_10]|uniref:Uncharacterized protein n=2 Tax=Candidatus Wolfeibacteriota TaxID=1752735 RepID=A0A0G1EGK4_9BACT|nr:MAG: hypothetical protein UV58_C0012G0017 [Candidatus Wolfebacteria bacterium GW2011_GWC1_43_10]KKT22333.1 MAG: hypothetical protein UW08_C0011G0002 [Parcubacteria group bacterium GW2011_GWB1_43_8b]OGM89315.1 MAG: hypothetical protein A2108_00735 [Candidatus Wolfebacteria bacterium GWA1_42_9]